ncbi:hypothetical protein CRG98_049679 [Punica granatum]|uniref:Uncharacterized protein n=1 Tax=Punica granatum TaxID=22663 RepID=A0A2I0H582_PUNGR|nr:hypothetical protein CRG98_049679 [Punica granatum]
MGKGGEIRSISLAAWSLMMLRIVLEWTSHTCVGCSPINLDRNLCISMISFVRASQWSRLVELVISGNSRMNPSDLEINKCKLLINDKQIKIPILKDDHITTNQ